MVPRETSRTASTAVAPEPAWADRTITLDENGAVTSIGAGQIITTGLINLRRFEQRGGEVRVIAELLGRQVTMRDGSGEATIEDVAIEEAGPGESAAQGVGVRSRREPRGATLRAGAPGSRA